MATSTGSLYLRRDSLRTSTVPVVNTTAKVSFEWMRSSLGCREIPLGNSCMLGPRLCMVCKSYLSSLPSRNATAKKRVEGSISKEKASQFVLWKSFSVFNLYYQELPAPAYFCHKTSELLLRAKKHSELCNGSAFSEIAGVAPRPYFALRSVFASWSRVIVVMSANTTYKWFIWLTQTRLTGGQITLDSLILEL